MWQHVQNAWANLLLLDILERKTVEGDKAQAAYTRYEARGRIVASHEGSEAY
jgi:hypothetical protein